MKKIGGYMAFFGLFAIVLNFFDRVPTILMWIYSWGDTAAWAIKIGLIVVGAVLFFMGKPEVEETELELPKEESAE
ncbi:hypothetical protein HNV10_07915 [Winogradskyella litoriviva]|uniref:Uncharacterized protein n=1 Tax=Winogradskyella litoriviva TaxID=1220182 RepID=A0ABX2E4E9_9FLAO|nr:hypothetical protein [Winogradskyella litoriviva]NRD23162.1 hypothetical protein [Winogradskyella litoriviva]